MADPRSAFVALAIAVLGGCADDRQALMLENLCRNNSQFFDINGNPIDACELSGDASYTTGIASNALAVRFGSAGGRIDIALAAIPAAHQSTWSFDVLVAANRPEGTVLGRPEIDWGSCGVACPATIAGVEVDLTEEIRWAIVVDNSPGTGTPIPAFGASPIPGDAALSIQGSDMHLLDVRTPGFDENAATPPSF